MVRYDKACKLAKENDVFLLIDAEESWMQDAADDLVEDMMRKYNTEKAIVFNTLQAYRWDRLDYLKQLYERSKTEGYKLGMKIVRGAYMEKNVKGQRKMAINHLSVKVKKLQMSILIMYSPIYWITLMPLPCL